jgi:hypothetical protein
MNSWLQPWVGENGACLTDFDAQIYAQSLQLGDLFGQDQLNFAQDMNQSAFYDELAFGKYFLEKKQKTISEQFFNLFLFQYLRMLHSK